MKATKGQSETAKHATDSQDSPLRLATEEYSGVITTGGIPYNSEIPRDIWNPSLTLRGSLQPKCAARVGVSDSDMPHSHRHSNFREKTEKMKMQLLCYFQMKKVVQLHKGDDSQIMEDLLLLSRGPTKYLTHCNGYIVNGYRFHVEDYDKKLRTQNCGVVVVGDTGNPGENVDYYGISRGQGHKYSTMSVNEGMESIGKKYTHECETSAIGKGLEKRPRSLSSSLGIGGKKDKFEGIELTDHREHILRWMNDLWNKWRGYLYGKYVKNKPLQQALKNNPYRIDKKEWEWLVKSQRNAANRAKLMMLHHMSSKPIRKIIYEKAQIEEIVNAEPSLCSMEIVEKCFGPQNCSHIVAFGGGVKAKDLKGGTSSKAELLSTLRSTQEENKYLNEENKSLNERLSALEDEMKEIRKIKEFFAAQQPQVRDTTGSPRHGAITLSYWLGPGTSA
ncbi:hypothetical protein FXO38_02865 [Capsicum annuum]|nr:hypothetical protein FXO38_02865 [Capsicum annuum]